MMMATKGIIEDERNTSKDSYSISTSNCRSELDVIPRFTSLLPVANRVGGIALNSSELAMLSLTLNM